MKTSRKNIVSHTVSLNQTIENSFSEPSRISPGKCSSVGGQTEMSRLIFLGITVISISMAIGFSGCCTQGGSGGGLGGWLDSYMQEQVACMQEKVWARRAFHLRFGHCERIHADHFRDGFVSGYCNVCDGKGGEIPALPPEKYWGFQYRNQEGAEMQTAWFSGYEVGAESAKSDGSGSFHEIQVSRQLEQAIMEAEDIKNLYSGITKEYVVDMAPVREGVIHQTQSAMPQTNSPYLYGQEPILESIPLKQAPVPQPFTIPGTQAGFDLNRPIPDESYPMAPVAPDFQN